MKARAPSAKVGLWDGAVWRPDQATAIAQRAEPMGV
jgi:hypothetical protein